MPLYNEPGAGQGKYPAILPESGFSNWGLHNFSDDTPLPDPDYDHGQDKREARGGGSRRYTGIYGGSCLGSCPGSTT